MRVYQGHTFQEATLDYVEIQPDSFAEFYILDENSRINYLHVIVRPDNYQNSGELRFSLGYSSSVEKQTLFGLSFANLEEWQLIAIFGMLSICLCFGICMGLAYRCKSKGEASPEKLKKGAPKKYESTENKQVIVDKP